MYNPNNVYFDWDDKLKGKKAFVADNINTLKLITNDSLEVEPIRIEKSADPNFPFLDASTSAQYKFCYPVNEDHIRKPKKRIIFARIGFELEVSEERYNAFKKYALKYDTLNDSHLHEFTEFGKISTDSYIPVEQFD